MSRPRRDPDKDRQPAGDDADLIRWDPAANAATPATAVSAAGRQARTIAEPPGLEPPESEWHDPVRPGYAPGRRHPSYAFTLAASPWFKERYPDKAANLWDALHAGHSPRHPTAEPDQQADREAGE